jgi:hypothetical protein
MLGRRRTGRRYQLSTLLRHSPLTRCRQLGGCHCRPAAARAATARAEPLLPRPRHSSVGDSDRVGARGADIGSRLGADSGVERIRRALNGSQPHRLDLREFHFRRSAAHPGHRLGSRSSSRAVAVVQPQSTATVAPGIRQRRQRWRLSRLWWGWTTSPDGANARTSYAPGWWGRPGGAGGPCTSTTRWSPSPRSPDAPANKASTCAVSLATRQGTCDDPSEIEPPDRGRSVPARIQSDADDPAVNSAQYHPFVYWYLPSPATRAEGLRPRPMPVRSCPLTPVVCRR